MTRCGWPFQLADSSTEVYCSLPVGHDGPDCKLLSAEGETVASVPRFGERGERTPR